MSHEYFLAQLADFVSGHKPSSLIMCRMRFVSQTHLFGDDFGWKVLGRPLTESVTSKGGYMRSLAYSTKKQSCGVSLSRRLCVESHSPGSGSCHITATQIRILHPEQYEAHSFLHFIFLLGFLKIWQTTTCFGTHAIFTVFCDIQPKIKSN